MMGASQSSTCSRLCGGGYGVDVSIVEAAVAKVAAEIDLKLKENAEVTTKERRTHLRANWRPDWMPCHRTCVRRMPCHRTNGEIAVRTEASTVNAVRELLDAKVAPAPVATFERRKRG